MDTKRLDVIENKNDKRYRTSKDNEKEKGSLLYMIKEDNIEWRRIKNRAKDIVIEGYRTILRRDPDSKGLSVYTNSINKGLSTRESCEILRSSKEYTQKFGDIDKDYFNNKGYIKNIRGGKYKVNGKNILVCILTYNGLKYMKRIIPSLKIQDCNHNLDLLVVDNCSTDGTLELLNGMAIKYELLEGRRCSAAGLNKCLEKLECCKYDYVSVLCNDVLLEESYIGTIVDDFDKQNRIRPGCLLMNGVQMEHTNDKIAKALSRNELQDFGDDVMTGDYCAFIVGKDIVDKVGYFDERYIPRYVEDNDFTHRIYLSGGYCMRNGKCKFGHVPGATFKDNIDGTGSLVQTMVRNSMIYKDKWGAFQKGGDRFHGLKRFKGEFSFDGGGIGSNSRRGNYGIFDYKKGTDTIVVPMLDEDAVLSFPVAKWYKNKGKKVILRTPETNTFRKISYIDNVTNIQNTYTDGYTIIPSISHYQREFDNCHMTYLPFILTICGIDIYKEYNFSKETLLPDLFDLIDIDSIKKEKLKRTDKKVGLMISSRTPVPVKFTSGYWNKVIEIFYDKGIKLYNLSKEKIENSFVDNIKVGEYMDMLDAIADMDFITALSTTSHWIALGIGIPSILILPGEDSVIGLNDPGKFSMRGQMIDKLVDTQDYWYYQNSVPDDIVKIVLDKLYSQ